jgi:hypothetical protein
VTKLFERRYEYRERRRAESDTLVRPPFQQ